MAADFFKKFVKDLGDADTSIAADGLASAEFTGYIDTGSYILNAAVSGTIYGGIPNNKACVLAGDPATGKTFFALGIVKAFLETHKNARVFYYDTESSVTNEMMTARGIDITRVAKSEPDSLESFRNKCSKLLDMYKELPVGDRFPLLIVLDSLSQLPSKKEIGDITEEKDTRDMTKPGVIKGTFRVLRLKMGKLAVPMVITNHVYASIGAYVPTKEIAGGSGAQYAADTIVMLSKKKEKDADNEVIGNVIHINMKKSRMSKENTKVDTRILYSGGLDRYYGLLEHAEAAGVVKKEGNKYVFPDGTKAFEKAIAKDPQKFWTKDVLDALDTYIQQEFKYQSAVAPEADNDGEEN
jgi:RecA/RadA recombinase